MTTDTCTEQRFLDDVKGHKLTILRDNGVDRHIRFKRPNGSCYWFDIITYPGRLIIDGDCGTYVFARIEDMFEFFRMRDNDYNKNPNGLSINPSYWGEKLRSVSNRGYGKGAIKNFSSDKFDRKVKEYFDTHFEDEIAGDALLVEDASDDYPLTAQDNTGISERKTRRDEIWSEIKDQVLGRDNEHEAYQAAYDFEEQGFQFQDFHEYRCEVYEFSYLWNCYAISYAIREYDKLKVTASVPAASIEP